MLCITFAVMQITCYNIIDMDSIRYRCLHSSVPLHFKHLLCTRRCASCCDIAARKIDGTSRHRAQNPFAPLPWTKKPGLLTSTLMQPPVTRMALRPLEIHLCDPTDACGGWLNTLLEIKSLRGFSSFSSQAMVPFPGFLHVSHWQQWTNVFGFLPKKDICISFSSFPPRFYCFLKIQVQKRRHYGFLSGFTIYRLPFIHSFL